MIEQSTKEWLQRMAYGHPAGGEVYRSEGSEHALRILAALDDADRDDKTLAEIEHVAPNPDDLAGSIESLVRFRERLVELLPEYPELGDDQGAIDDLLAGYFAAGQTFRTAVVGLLVDTGVMAPDDQTSDPVNLLRLFLPSGVTS